MSGPGQTLVAITGASGLIGSALREDLLRDGIGVRVFVRRPPRSEHEIAWQPGADVDPAALAGVTAVVHLAGAGVGDHRWTTSYKQQIRDSRVVTTNVLATALPALPQRIQTPIDSDTPSGVLSCSSRHRRSATDFLAQCNAYTRAFP